jgi:hypothetical protein
MNKYIDAEKLIAEIERRIESWTIRGKHSPAGQGRDTCDSRVTELSDLLPFVTSLQQEQPDADFEKELTNERTKLLDAFGPMNGEQCLAIRNFARHLYELGLNARKGE